ncbi:MAG: sulfite exporter TauE/SafE family protein [Candidatus Puniceispirillaceae bacterium]
MTSAELARSLGRNFGLESVVAFMDMMLVCLIAAGLSGGFVNGLAGFGTSLFALGWLLQVMPPREAVAIALACSVVTGVPGVWQVRHSMDARRLGVFLVPALLGVPLGLFALDLINARLLSLFVGAMLLVYGGYFAFRRNLPSITGRWLALEAGIGFVGGALGSMAGLSGALPSMWLAMRPWPKGQQRGILQPFNMVILTLATVLLAFDGGFGGKVLYNLGVALLASVVGAAVGLWLFGRLSDYGYRRLLIVLMLFSGLSLLMRTLIA